MELNPMLCKYRNNNKQTNKQKSRNSEDGFIYK